MFDANMRYLPKGCKFVADVWGLKQTSILSRHGVKVNTLILCEMLDEDCDNPSVEVISIDGSRYTVSSHDEGLFSHNVLYYGEITKEGNLQDFRYEEDKLRAKALIDSLQEGVFENFLGREWEK
ncbi:hypothetical protein NVP1063O_012 [Vibrio phage 1.063.O._10N.261.45.C7]|nr:hypothetical protein NVP1063O_012 [Vibrio phage 1.063.O._10N.261.45.C7]